MNIFDLAAKITLDTKGYESGLKKAEGMIAGVGKKMVSIGKGAAAAAGVVVTAAGAGFTKLTKDAYNATAEYEQNVGGIMTMFGAASHTVINNSKEAYKTAGVSANEYMQQLTSFSASLIQSLNGDTVKAAKIGDMAMRDMSDNANKFGTDITSIQNAYQGFAKQNYTMLDNLKLGRPCHCRAA